MTDPRLTTYETYISGWSAHTDADRAQLLADSLSEDVVFTNSTQTRHGRNDVAAHLAAFQRSRPDTSFRTNEMLGWDNHGLATWQFLDAQGEPGFFGYDVVAFDDDGRIREILMFTHAEHQTLK